MHKGVNKKQKNYLKEKNTKNYAAYMQTNRIHKYAIQQFRPLIELHY